MITFATGSAYIFSLLAEHISLPHCLSIDHAGQQADGCSKAVHNIGAGLLDPDKQEIMYWRHTLAKKCQVTPHRDMFTSSMVALPLHADCLLKMHAAMLPPQICTGCKLSCRAAWHVYQKACSATGVSYSARHMHVNARCMQACKKVTWCQVTCRHCWRQAQG